MASENTTSIVIPAFNEERRLADLLAALAVADRDLANADLGYLEAVIVDDGSSDRTAAMIRSAAAEDHRVRPVLERRQNLGKGRSLRDGVMAAEGTFVLFADVDLSTPLSEARKLAEGLRRPGFDIAIGSRDKPGSVVEAPVYRRILGTGFNFAVRRLTGLDYGDTQCGFKLMRTEVARELMKDQISPGFAFDVELLMRAEQAGLEVIEVPVDYFHDDRSKVRVARASVTMARDLVIMSRRIRSDGRRRQGKRRPEGAPPS
jgi:dolichyl-phosphate beta-glucosyltransferase